MSPSWCVKFANSKHIGYCGLDAVYMAISLCSQWARVEQEELILFVYFYSNAELVAAANDMMSTHHAKLDK